MCPGSPLNPPGNKRRTRSVSRDTAPHSRRAQFRIHKKVCTLSRPDGYILVKCRPTLGERSSPVDRRRPFPSSVDRRRGFSLSRRLFPFGPTHSVDDESVETMSFARTRLIIYPGVVPLLAGTSVSDRPPMLFCREVGKSSFSVGFPCRSNRNTRVCRRIVVDKRSVDGSDRRTALVERKIRAHVCLERVDEMSLWKSFGGES